ncbi:twin-arginine translocase subunit TatC [Leifsonia sp. 21MFCrub1.1]|uniref:twin-arginine translocase subunit TatC n=1 Tax=Leifsonia sp. 21MFCrub1.1 TaxID=1798223 RepID=UPI0008929788|nr:twin-arginine translocase subunit TatC [Leifsonia sp. 21MFCrub1.1]SEA80731.1 sec-independent protein translocase protein TatC [Leifsonia sp. 21MFCrub1.1]
MTLAEHFIELRKRLFRSALALVGGAVVGWFLSGYVMDALRGPITDIAKQQGREAMLNYDSITGAFDLKMQVAITIGAIISSPVWLYQIWAFFVPAMTRKELRYGFGFFFTAVPLFIAGGVTGWLLVPHIVSLLTSFAPEPDSAIIQAKTYFDFILKLVIAVGIAFVLPVFLVLLNFVGVLSAKSIIASWRWALILIALFTAIATPAADVLSMFLLAIPMVALYFAAYGVAWLHDRRAAKRELRLEAELAA